MEAGIIAVAPVPFVTLRVIYPAVEEALERTISHPGPVAEGVVVANHANAKSPD